MQLLKIEDGRGNLERMTQTELEIIAKRAGIVKLGRRVINTVEWPEHDINGAPSVQIMAELRERGILGPDMHHRVLGQPKMWRDECIAKDNAPSPKIVVEPLPQQEKPVSEMTRAEMAKECKRRGIKMARTDTKEQLAEKLRVAHAG